MATFISRSPEQTQALGESWGKLAAAGLVIGLTGDLGAGKTELVKGLARGLGVKAHVHSPTFALIHEYTDGRLPLFHIDLYRLESAVQIVGAGLEEYFYNPPGVTVIEWAERCRPLTPALSPDGGEGGRVGAENSPKDFALQPPTGQSVYRQVTILTLSETERSISYEDTGA